MAPQPSARHEGAASLDLRPAGITTDSPASSSQRSQNLSGNEASLPSISLPKGGGSIGGMGEKFNVNPADGTGALTVPIRMSPSRRGFNPNLSLNYSSGNGNGPFGLGWSLSESSITRKTSKGIPQYIDDMDSDVFILGGMEDLVPLLKKDGNKNAGHPTFWEESLDGYVIRRYSPRIEGSFNRIERWTRTSQPRDVHWRVTSPESVTSIYGATANAQIHDPDQDSTQNQRIFSWLLSEQYDMVGNAIIYTYKEEDSVGVSLDSLNEKNRTHTSRSSNRYLKMIRYGNKKPNRDIKTWEAFSPSTLAKDDWMFTVALDYGEFDEEQPSFVDGRQWRCRKDPFSSYRSGFEIRTYRLCKRVLMFHSFKDELSRDQYLVSSTDFAYAEESYITYLTSATHVSYLLDGDKMRSKSLPPLEFDYSTFPSDDILAQRQAQDVDPVSLQNLPSGVNENSYQWVDLDGEGLTGVLAEQGGGWFYKRNQSANNSSEKNTDGNLAPSFGPLEQIFSKPPSSLTDPQVHLTDVQGDGALDLVQVNNSTWGFYSRKKGPDIGWASFQEFKSSPSFNTKYLRMTFVDLTGDGLADIFITEDDSFVFYPSLGEEGYGGPNRVSQALDEETGPRIVLEDTGQTVHLADMTGDGMVDLVRIRNGEVCYWPNLGYGRFGAKVTLDDSPWFDSEDSYNPQWLHIADIDGSGTADIIYSSAAAIDIYRNNSGNAFSGRKRLTTIPPVDQLSSIETLDLLGNGTSCIVWSSRNPGDGQASMKYIDFTRGKPHLLVGQRNNLGGETRVQYAPSTKFYLDDKEAGRPWITTLPFPVQCVETVETIEQVTGNRFVNRYSYHHGYFDGVEREFRGFAMVEQWDTEEFDRFPASTTNSDQSWHSPPVHSKSWFSTGSFIGEGGSELALEYFEIPQPDGTSDAFSGTLLEDSMLPSGLNLSTTREACRALKGRLLRRELYSDDKSPKAKLPFSISESNSTVRSIQPQEMHGHGIFHVVPRETLQLNFERQLIDPRIQHGLAVEIDEYGNPLKSIQITYGRKKSPLDESGDRECQEKMLITYSEKLVTNQLDDRTCYRLPTAYEACSYQLYGYEKDFIDRLALSQFSRNELSGLPTIPYEAQPNGSKQRRLLSKSRTLFRSDDLTGLLAAGKLESMAFAGESYTQAFTPGLLDFYQKPNPESSGEIENLILNVKETMGKKGGGYVNLDLDGNWWIPSGRSFFHSQTVPSEVELAEGRKHFFLTTRAEDPFGNISRVTYDLFDLFATESLDALQNSIKCVYDYRVLLPYLATDPNGNRSQCAFDELGHVVATAVMGQRGENEGDSLDNFHQATPEEIQQFFLDPHGPVKDSLLGNASTRTVYDITRFWKEPDPAKKKPIFYATIGRETHASESVAGQHKTQVSFSYSDGLGRVVQAKAQARPGADGQPQWCTSGWTILNNKGNPVRRFEPFFSTAHEYISDQKVGASSILVYDAVDRVVATINPNHTLLKTVFDNWTSKTYDSNDTILIDPKSDPDICQFVKLLPEAYYRPTWYEQRISGLLGPDEKTAAEKSAKHSDTPAVTHLDVLGRPFLSIADNGEFGKYATRTTLDIQGRTQQVKDAQGRLAQKYTYNMVGNLINENNLESGQRWTMFDVGGGVLLHWDARGNQFQVVHDELGREIASVLRQEKGLEILVRKIFYGESLTRDGQTEKLICRNGRGRAVKIYDQAGIIVQADYDFKGNLLTSDRQLGQNYKSIIDWNHPVPMEEEVYVSSATFDALNRPVETTSADDSVISHTYDEAGLLNGVTGRIQNSSTPASFIRSTQYNAKGQRTLTEYGNGVKTEYTYDRNTFALIRILSRRDEKQFPEDQPSISSGRPVASIQDLNYTFDSVGNITKVADNSQQRIFHKGIVVEPSNEYTYDPLYRLLGATGREHLSLAKKPTAPGALFNTAVHLNDGTAMGRYIETYKYDEVGNFVSMKHESTSSNSQGVSRFRFVVCEAYSYANHSSVD